MARKYFGTDGIRGLSNKAPMDAATSLKVGMATGAYFRKGTHRHRVVIGKDTRLSGYLIEPALTAGFLAMGMDVFLLGPMPTPAVSMLTRSLRADLGVMISASHNPYHDNGIKFFDPGGNKLSDEVEMEIETLMEQDLTHLQASPDKLGKAKRIDDAPGRYMQYVKQTFPKNLRLDGLKIVIDCANGAAYKLAPTILWELGAEVIEIGVEPNGYNINHECGSTHPKEMRKMVVEHDADIGIALDGDADRLVVCDEEGIVIDGDQIMAAIATYWQDTGQLKNDGLVATVMSNMGLEVYLASRKLKLERAKVGDRYVIEQMQKHGYNLGGEQSGHIIFSDHSNTGDGLVAALQVLAHVIQSGKPASEVLRVFTPYPQILKNIRFDASKADPLETENVKKAIEDAENTLGVMGRILIRKSGTEPLIRVMAEAEDSKATEAAVNQIINAIEAAQKVMPIDSKRA